MEFFYDLSKTVDENAQAIKSKFKWLNYGNAKNLALWMIDRKFYSITATEVETLEGTVI